MGIKSIKSIDKILTMRATWSRRDVLDFLTEIIDGGVIPHGRFRDSSDGNMVPRRRFRDSSDSSRRMYTRRRYRDSVKGDGNEPPFTYYHRNTRHSVFRDLLDALSEIIDPVGKLAARVSRPGRRGRPGRDSSDFGRSWLSNFGSANWFIKQFNKQHNIH